VEPATATNRSGPHRVNTITRRFADLAQTGAGSIPAKLTIRFGSDP
jgi:hypothetical protein